MGTGASASLYRRDSNASLGRQDSYSMSRSTRLRSSFGSMWHSLKHVGSSWRHSANDRLQHFDSSFYNLGDDRREYMHYSVYGDGEGSDPENNPYVYQLQRTKAMDENQWFDMAAANEQLTKTFNNTKNAFQKYYKKHWKKKHMTPEEIRAKEEEKNKWREFFAKTQTEHEERQKVQEEARRKRQEARARLPPPVPHPCAQMKADEKTRYYEKLFGYTLRNAPWVDSPRWQSLEVPVRRTRRLSRAPSSSSSTSSSRSSSSGTTTTSTTTSGSTTS